MAVYRVVRHAYHRVLELVSLDRYVKLTEDQRNQIKLLEQEHVATCHGHCLAALCLGGHVAKIPH